MKKRSCSEKEQLLWERDLMGLYLSAHPLDKYDVYFDEQTHPMSAICPENQDKTACVGGIITNVRTILTSKGDKMAFVKIENKAGEAEIIVFPKVYATCGAKLEIDNVIRVQGQIDAKDREGNLSSEAKLKAEMVELVSDSLLENYKATGTKLAQPWIAPKREGAAWRKRGNESISDNQMRVLKNIPKDHRGEKLFLLVEGLEDTEILSKVRQLADEYIGPQEVVLVVKEGDKKQALKMPFRVDASEGLVTEMKQLLGEECVKIA